MANPSFDEPQLDIEATIQDLDRKIARLRMLYEQYFLGIERRAPEQQLKQVVRLIYVLEQASIKNTALKFRFRSQVQKFQSFRTYWHRICREIENGTYKRHVAKAKAREARLAAYGEDFEVEGEEAMDGEDPFATPIPELPQNKAAVKETSDLAEDFLKELGWGEPTPAPARPTPPAPAPRPQAPVAAPQPAAASSRPAPPWATEAAAPQGGGDVRGVSADDAQRRMEALKRLQERLGSQRGAPAGAASSGPTARPPAPGAPALSSPPQPRTISRAPLERHPPRAAEPAAPAAQPAAAASSAPPAAERPGTLGSRRTLSRPAIQRPSGSAAPRPAAQAGAMADEGVRSSLENSGLTERRLQNIYENLVDAKRRCNESTAGLSYDSVVRSIAKQAPALQQKSSDGKVDFQVVVKEGKAYLKPVTSSSSRPQES